MIPIQDEPPTRILPERTVAFKVPTLSGRSLVEGGVVA